MIYGIKYLQQLIAESSSNKNDQVRSNINKISGDTQGNSDSEVIKADEILLEPRNSSGTFKKFIIN